MRSALCFFVICLGRCNSEQKCSSEKSVALVVTVSAAHVSGLVCFRLCMELVEAGEGHCGDRGVSLSRDLFCFFEIIGFLPPQRQQPQHRFEYTHPCSILDIYT